MPKHRLNTPTTHPAVAVVGAAHLPGIAANWGRTDDATCNQLLLPPTADAAARGERERHEEIERAQIRARTSANWVAAGLLCSLGSYYAAGHNCGRTPEGLSTGVLRVRAGAPLHARQRLSRLRIGRGGLLASRVVFRATCMGGLVAYMHYLNLEHLQRQVAE